MRGRWVVGWLAVILLAVNYAVYEKEKHLEKGVSVCLRLAPVDPRSLMQGDYMALRYVLAGKIRAALRREYPRHGRLPDSEGRVLLDVESNCTAAYAGIFVGQKLRKGQIILRYRVRNGRVKIASNAFFFREGSGERYAKARYGLFKVRRSEPLLIDLLDADLRSLSAGEISERKSSRDEEDGEQNRFRRKE